MDRSNMRSSYINSGPRSLPHMGSKRHSGHNGMDRGHSGMERDRSHNGSSHNGSGHNARLSPPAQMPTHNHNQHDDLINYIYESWNKVTREMERGSEDAKYYQEMVAPRQLANFRAFDLEEWWGRRLMQATNRNKHRS